MSDVPVQISLRKGRGEILVAGHDIANAVTGLVIRSEPGDATRMVVTLSLPLLKIDDDRADVLFVDDVHDALISMGWTPPQEDA